MRLYNEDDLLLLSGIQHMAFCERQWALIHIEQQWAENTRTVEGKHLHENTDEAFIKEHRKDLLVVRAMPVVTFKLGLHGIADVVEYHKQCFHSTTTTCKIKTHNGWWKPVPVEYKRGRPKSDDRDAVQLCAQAIAIEEMMKVNIEYGFLYYGQTRHRKLIKLDSLLRSRTINLSKRMHFVFNQGNTPAAEKGKRCSQCSLFELCQPKLTKNKKSVINYINSVCNNEEWNI